MMWIKQSNTQSVAAQPLQISNSLIIESHASKKKTLAAAERQSPANTGKRAEYIKIQKFLPASRIAFLDETGINTGMTKPYGWGKAG
jgi:hypothetical protein